MLNEKIYAATTKTLLFSGITGVLGIGVGAVGEQICDMSLWQNLQLVKLVVASGVGNALLGLPVGIYNAWKNRDSVGCEDCPNGSLEKKALMWVSITGGVGSLAGARILCLVDSTAKALSAASIGAYGGITLGICALYIGGVYYAVTASRSGNLTFGRLSMAMPEGMQEGMSIEDNDQRTPLLQGIEAIESIDSDYVVIIDRPLPDVEEASRIIETRLKLSVERHPVEAVEAQAEEDWIEIDLDSPVNSLEDNPEPASEPKRRRWCSIL